MVKSYRSRSKCLFRQIQGPNLVARPCTKYRKKKLGKNYASQSSGLNIDTRQSLQADLRVPKTSSDYYRRNEFFIILSSLSFSLHFSVACVVCSLFIFFFFLCSPALCCALRSLFLRIFHLCCFFGFRSFSTKGKSNAERAFNMVYTFKYVFGVPFVNI